MPRFKKINETSPQNYDLIVVGSGLSGAVFAERAAQDLNLRVLVIEKRDHIAGNCFDYVNSDGILIHKYGPHIFHTSNERVWRYLSKFTHWTTYHHQVVAEVGGKKVPVPFNLNSVDVCFPPEKARTIQKTLVSNYGQGARVPVLELMVAKDPILKELGCFVYENIFLNYTCKQWGCRPEEISPEVTARVPIIVNRVNGYFNDKYQAMPTEGYTALIRKIIDHERIDVVCACDFMDIANLENGKILINQEEYSGGLIYTGSLDELFSYCYGVLPYRSLKFQLETHDKEEFQNYCVVNYPNDASYTRITEFKHLYGKKVDRTTIVKEYPENYEPKLKKNIPYYPLFNEESRAHFHSYQKLIKQYKNIINLGRLAEYKYFDMDDAVDSSLKKFELYKEKYEKAGYELRRAV